MSRGQNPLFWMMACTLPSAGHALGLGDIHVDSSLNEPLVADIDIVGATPEDLIGLIATVANRETFAHFNAERPPFLNSATFKVTTDAKGKPVLAIRSSESFSEPLIDLVVDLRWRNGQLIRQYSLLLDPAGFPAATQTAAALPVPPTQADLPQAVITAASSPASNPSEPANNSLAEGAPAAVAQGEAANNVSTQLSTRAMTQIKVGARATLRGVAWRVGARSDADLNQMMIAIFRANPSAFDGNINRLHLGAMLRIPSAEEVEAIPHAEANRETRAQMKEWLASVKRPGTNAVSAVAEAAPAAVPAASQPVARAPVVGAASVSPAGDVAAAPAQAATPTQAAAPAQAVTSAQAAAPSAAPVQAGDAASEKAALTTQLLSLEGNLHELQAQLEDQHNKLLTLQAQQRYAEQHPQLAAPVTEQNSSRGLLTAALAGMAALAAACVALLMRLRRRANTNYLPSIEKVPVVAQLGVEPPAPNPKPKVAVRAPEASRIEVQEHHEVPDEPRADARAGMPSMRLETQEEPMESALELSIGDTSGINAIKLREELAAAKLREEIAAAWALPAAETYKREDMDHESTLAMDIAKSLEDTLNLEQPSADDTIEEAYTDTIVNSDAEPFAEEAGATARYSAATALMPAPDADPEPEVIHIDAENLDYNLLDLDGADAYVNMEGTTQEQAVIKDRRTSLVDVLKQAIEREPDRRDLRIKLLETYYNEADINRQAFIDAIQDLAQNRGDMDDAEWQKIEQMGRDLGADSPAIAADRPKLGADSPELSTAEDDTLARAS